jgi:hypothetical protein
VPVLSVFTLFGDSCLVLISASCRRLC